MAELINKTGTFSERIIHFYSDLNPDFVLPAGVEVLHPYAKAEVKPLIEQYYTRFYSDDRPKIYLFGINPGRLGGGLTGIPFTDPVQLSKLSIVHEFEEKSELSSDFIYKLIDAYGGMKKFAKNFFLTAISPLGFTLQKKNYNYYDHPMLEAAIRPWILKTMQEQLSAGANRKIAVSIGEGSNFKYMCNLNHKEQWFEEVIALPHPRWIMQYRRKSLTEFIERYVETLNRIRP
jgi:hypothetical protein